MLALGQYKIIGADPRDLPQRGDARCDRADEDFLHRGFEGSGFRRIEIRQVADHFLVDLPERHFPLAGPAPCPILRPAAQLAPCLRRARDDIFARQAMADDEKEIARARKGRVIRVSNASKETETRPEALWREAIVQTAGGGEGRAKRARKSMHHFFGDPMIQIHDNSPL